MLGLNLCKLKSSDRSEATSENSLSYTLTGEYGYD